MREVWGAPLVRRGEAVGGAQDAGGAAVEDVGVAEGVAGGALGDALTAYRLLHRALQHGFVQVVAAALTGLAVQVRTGGGEDPLPDPLAAGVGVFAAEGPGQLDPAGAAAEIGGVQVAPPPGAWPGRGRRRRAASSRGPWRPCPRAP